MTSSTGVGIVACAGYVPTFRLDRAAITATLGTGGGRGHRAVASFDEDTTTMGVEAARLALRGIDPAAVDRLLFSTADPAYLDKTNATALHAALGLSQRAMAVDFGGAPRSSVGAVLAGATMANGEGHSLVVCSDTRTGLAGGADEATGGDGAAALVLGRGSAVVAELVGHGASTAEFLDRWRTPGSHSQVWEERFGETEYVPLAAAAMADALKVGELGLDNIDHLLVSGVHNRAVGVIAKSLVVRPGVLVDDLTSKVGNTGTAHSWLLLADVLERASAGQTIVQVVVADGVDVLIWRTTAALAERRDAISAQKISTSTVSAQINAGNASLSYPQFLTWKGELRREPPRRPDPDRVSAPASGRGTAWKYGFTASRCLDCGTRHLPPMRVCLTCHSVDHMTEERLADVVATVATFTVDRLAFSLSPPVVAGVIDFDGGGRFQCELTDCAPSDIAIGTRVSMTFRRLNTAQGIHNYFWKAKPVQG